MPNSGEANSSIPLHPQPLNVAPIRWYSSTPDINAGSVSVEAITSPSKRSNSQQHAGGQPAVVFFSACPAREDRENFINHANGGVALTGLALLGEVGSFMGSVDIAESEDAYVFRVSLPVVARDKKVFRCDVGPNGRIFIRGVSVTGERKVHRKNMVFKMQTQNLCPPGEFTVSFQLPGPIDHLNLSCNLGPDGIFECIAKKKQQVLQGPVKYLDQNPSSL
ncbi:Increased DNA methylation 2 [Capsicum annuum]|uniref:Increased DNA methylation 2 n=1 Tax=Capsicum annuum TaxID=4072 RepID=A0A2G2XU78_CAPAN|nr:Increased DNA methylation 2 [Capsicum annuum]